MNHLVKSNSFKPASKSDFQFRSGPEPTAVRAGLRRSEASETLVVIDGRTLVRECLVRSIEMSHPRIAVLGYSSIDEWRAAPKPKVPATLLVNIAARLVSDPTIGSEIACVAAEAMPTPVVVLANSEELREMIAALDRGARGYIPASVGVDAIVEATRLAVTGGIFLPAASLLSMRHAITQTAPATGIEEEHFTSRQSAVAAALRQGKPNKIIAHQLQMSESTVKTHIRNIMKKLKAANRTEAAFKLTFGCGAQMTEHQAAGQPQPPKT